MGNDKTNIFLVAIVGIVAVAGLVFLFSGKSNIVMVSAEDSLSGMAAAATCTNDINSFKAETMTNGDKRYSLKWYDGNGMEVQMPLISFSNEGIWVDETLPEPRQVHFVETDSIKKNDYLILSPKGASKSYLVQYKGADNLDTNTPQIKFKNVGTGETLTYTISKGTNSVTTISLGGYSFGVFANSTSDFKDFPIKVDLNGKDGVKNLPVKIYSGKVAFMIDKAAKTLTIQKGTKKFKVEVGVGEESVFSIFHLNGAIKISSISKEEITGTLDGCTNFKAHPDSNSGPNGPLVFELTPIIG